MKQFVITLLSVLLLAGTVSAQRRFQVGIRGGINTVDHHFSSVGIGDARIWAGPAKIGYEAGFVLRFNLLKHLHLQSELNYNFVNYAFRIVKTLRRDITMRTERFEIPVELGLQFGPVRLFGGASFRIATAQHCSAPDLFKVRFNDHDIAIIGGIGLNIRKFFFDFRVTGYPSSHIWNRFTYDGESLRVKVARNIVYGGSLGFFF